jgi:hypothetical protein
MKCDRPLCRPASSLLVSASLADLLRRRCNFRYCRGTVYTVVDVFIELVLSGRLHNTRTVKESSSKQQQLKGTLGVVGMQFHPKKADVLSVLTRILLTHHSVVIIEREPLDV